MRREDCCLDCQELIATPITNEPRNRLNYRETRLLPRGAVVALYDCRQCGAEPIREERLGQKAQWKLL